MRSGNGKLGAIMSTKTDRRTPKQTRSRVVVDSIVEASRRLLSQHARLNTASIARVAGVSIGSLYQYFSSKEDVLSILIYVQLKADLDELKAAMIEYEKYPLRVMFRKVTEKVFPRSPAQIAFLMEIVPRVDASGQRKLLEARFDEMVDILAAQLQKRPDELRPGIQLPEAAHVAIWSARSGFLHALRRQPDVDLDWLIDELVLQATSYLLKPDAEIERTIDLAPHANEQDAERDDKR